MPTILVGTDGSDSSLKAVGYAAELARLQDAELLILFASPPSEESASRVLDKAEAAAASTGCPVRTMTAKGDPAEALITVAEKESVDVIALGNKGMSGVRRFLLGSVPNKVSHHAPCDLLIVKTV